MSKFKYRESVILTVDDFSASGKVISVLDNDLYLVFYCGKGGWRYGIFHESLLESFGNELFVAGEEIRL